MGRDLSLSLIPAIALSFAAGAVSTWVWQQWRKRRAIHAGATLPGDDLSLFYAERDILTTIHPRCKFLEEDLYANVVRNTVVCCVDIVLVRRGSNGRRQCLLVERASDPAKGIWWWPGGRLLKGETFFNAAIRKAKQETGIDADRVRPVQVLGVWNTFFPTSAWDTDTIKGTQTVNPIVLVEFINDMDGAEIKLDNQSENLKWISLNPADNQSEDKYVLAALNRLAEWDPLYAYS
jgi:colanic acid biosynthesis protein WcaH